MRREVLCIQKIKEKGQGAVEYALVLGIVAIIAIYLVNQGNLQDKTSKALDNVSNAATIINAKMTDVANPSDGN